MASSTRTATVSCHGDAHPGYGFNILNERAQPVLSLAFERKDEAEQGEPNPTLRGAKGRASASTTSVSKCRRKGGPRRGSFDENCYGGYRSTARIERLTLGQVAGLSPD